MLGWFGRRQARMARPDPRERIYAVGDVHGRADLLDRLLERIDADIAAQADARTPRVVMLGDYVDRGPASRAVLETLSALQARLGAQVVCLKGNHEAALLDFLDDPAGAAGWLRFGGLETLASYGIAPPSGDGAAGAAAREAAAAALRAALGPHEGFLRGLPSLFGSGDVLFAHAGVDPDSPLDAQGDAALLWGRSRFADVERIPGHLVVHGHYAGPQVVRRAGRICVDTGAYYTGRLTAVRLDDEVAFLSS